MKDRFNLRLYSEKRHEYVYINTIGYEDGKISYIDILDPSNELYTIEISVNDLGKDYVLECCTGMKDKYDNLIYEGDIVCDNEYHLEVKEQNGCFIVTNGAVDEMLYLEVKEQNGGFIVTDGAVDEMLYLDLKEYEIIGNIHEDPELLEGNNG